MQARAHAHTHTTHTEHTYTHAHTYMHTQTRIITQSSNTYRGTGGGRRTAAMMDVLTIAQVTSEDTFVR